MTWSYDPEIASRVDEIHFLVGDTDDTDPLLQDEEIARLLVVYPPATDAAAPYLAAAAACEAIAGRFAREVQNAVGPLSESAQQRFEHYKTLAADFRTAFQTNGIGVPAVGVVPPAIPVLGGGGPTYLGGP